MIFLGGAAVTESSDNSGYSTSSELVVEKVLSSDNGQVFLCRAKNELIVEAVNDGLIMNVRCKYIQLSASKLCLPD